MASNEVRMQISRRNGPFRKADASLFPEAILEMRDDDVRIVVDPRKSKLKEG